MAKLRLAVCAAASIAIAVLASAATDSPAQAAPAWVADSWSQSVGTWIASNDAYKSESEPYDAYGLEWHWGVGRRSLKGRLYALANGRELGTLFEYREFWHPAERAVVVEQFGSDGTYAVGKLERRADGTTSLLQTFYDPSGSTFRAGHTVELKGDVRVARQYDVDQQGAWKAGRTYHFKRSPAS